MKKLLSIILLIISFINIFDNHALSSLYLEEQEAARKFLQDIVRYTNNKSVVAREENSTSNSPTVLTALKVKFPNAHSENIQALQTYKTPPLRNFSHLMPLPVSMYQMPLIIVSPRLGSLIPTASNIPAEDQQLVSASINWGLTTIGMKSYSKEIICPVYLSLA